MCICLNYFTWMTSFQQFDTADTNISPSYGCINRGMQMDSDTIQLAQGSKRPWFGQWSGKGGLRYWRYKKLQRPGSQILKPNAWRHRFKILEWVERKEPDKCLGLQASIFEPRQVSERGLEQPGCADILEPVSFMSPPILIAINCKTIASKRAYF